MSHHLKPRDAKEVETAIREAAEDKKSLEIIGHGSKRALSRSVKFDTVLDLSGLSGVTLYEPQELVLSAQAGTPLAEIEALAASQGQELAFEPMDFGPLLGGKTGQATLGGVIAANISGPRRIKQGAARDHFLGFSAVSGRGETFKSGGRVVKNVTGYDLCKLMAGSWGTLAAITDITIKTLPRAEMETTLLVLGLNAFQAGKIMAAAMGSSCDVSGAAHLPNGVAVRVSSHIPVSHSATAFRLEGVEPSVAHRIKALGDLLASHGEQVLLNSDQSQLLWQSIRDVVPFAADGPSGEKAVWRISTEPVKGALLTDLIARQADGEFLYDWAGGLIWAALTPSDDGGASLIRDAVAACGGHATLIRASAALRAVIAPFEPQQSGVAALTKRVKQSFDPLAILGPGRMWVGI